MGLGCAIDKWLVALVVLGASCGTTAAADGQPLQLTPEQPLALSLTEGETQTITLELPSGAWLLEANEDFVDVVIEVNDLSGVNRSTLYGIDTGHSEIRYLVVADEPVNRSLTITAKKTESQSASLALTLSRVNDALKDPNIRTALHLDAALSAFSRDASDAEFTVAIDQAIAAAQFWQRAGDRRRAGINQYYAASLAYALEQIQQSHDLALQSAQLLDPTNDNKWYGFALNLAGLSAIRLRKLDRAQSLLNDAERALASMYGGRALNPATSNLCFLLSVEKKPDQIEACYRKLLPIAEELGDTVSTAVAWRNIAGAYRSRGDFSGAAEILEAALQNMASETDPRLRASLHIRLGLMQDNLGYLQRSIANYERALEISRDIGDDRTTARVLSNLGAIYSRLGIPRRAISLLRESASLRESGLPELLGITKRNLANALLTAGEHEAAERLFDEVSAIAKPTRDQRTLNNVALGRAKNAILQAQHRDAISQLKPLVSDINPTDLDQRTFAQASVLYARALLADEEPAKGLAAAQQAEHIFKSQGAVMERAESMALMGWCLWELERRDEAQALAKRSIALVDSVRGNIASADLRASYQAAVADASELLVISHIQLDEDPALALRAAEKSRARVLIDVLSKSNDAPASAVPEELIRQREFLHSQINESESRRIRGLPAADIGELAIKLDALDGQIAQRDPRYRAATQFQALQPAAMQALLDANDVVVQFFLGKRRSYRWLITREHISAQEIPEAARLDALAREAHTRLSKRASIADIMLELGDALLTDVAPLLDANSNVIVVADRGLHYVPFDALRAGTDTRPIFKNATLTYSPSLTTLALNRENQRQNSNAIAVLADPVFSSSDQRITAPSVVTRSGSNGSTLNRLAMSAVEAKSILRLATDYRVDVFTGFDANVDALTNDAVTQADVLHIATHGFVDDEIPERNGLALSIRTAKGQPRPGFVGLRDIYDLELNAQLVVLSACDTALGRNMAGEGLLGLTRGFMYAGAERVLASLWQVEDRATAQLMEHFYTALLRDGLSPAAALARAKAELQVDRRWRHPYFWSGFVLLGDWMPLR